MCAELRHYAKFCQNSFNRGQDIAIFGFFKMTAAVILDFRNFKFITDGNAKNFELPHCAKCRLNRSNRGRYNYVDFCFFSIQRPPPSWIFDIYNFYDRNDQEDRTLSSGFNFVEIA